MTTPCGAPEPRPRTWRAAAGLVALLGALAVGLAGSSSGHSPDPIVLAGFGRSSLDSNSSPASPTTQTTQTTGSFTISGTVGGLYPGLTRPLVLTVKNPLPFAIVVTSITTTVENASATCPASNMTVAAFSGQLLVPPAGSAQTSVLVGMTQNASDACMATTFPLVYRGTATKAAK